MKLHSTLHPLSATVREAVAPVLQKGLVLGIDLERQAKQAHWTLRGPTFITLHEFFDEIADASQEFTDLAAERLMALGGMADGTSGTVAATTSLPAFPVRLMAAEEQIERIRQALAHYAAFVYDAIQRAGEAGDPTTSDVFTEISRGLDQLLWKIEAHQPER